MKNKILIIFVSLVLVVFALNVVSAELVKPYIEVVFKPNTGGHMNPLEG